MQTNKIKTYLNFAIKSGKLIYGLDNISAYNKKAYLFIVSSGVNEKFLNNILHSAEKLDSQVFETEQSVLDEMLNTFNCKAVLLRNKNLADAIIKENSNMKILREVNLIESNK